MASKKHYIITSLTLGAIAAASAALIGVTNLITKDQIVKNEKNKINAGIVQIYGKNATISSDLELKGYQYSNHLYVVDNGENQESLALRTTGSNMYGKISLIAGFKLFVMPEGENKTGLQEFRFIGMYVVTNEQTYNTTLEENYIDPLNNGERDVEDVNCGATYGAKLIRDMINEAKDVANEQLGKNNNG